MTGAGSIACGRRRRGPFAATRAAIELGLPPSHPTLPSLLRDAGYSNRARRQWHLGYPPHFGPLKSGYQEFFRRALRRQSITSLTGHVGQPRPVRKRLRGTPEGYLHGLISDRAIEFHRRKRKDRSPVGIKRAALALAHARGRGGVEAHREDLSLRRRFRSDYLTMIANGRGHRRILRLKAAKADRDTLVVFTSDNGGERFFDTWPLVGKKMDLLEAAIRVPYIVRWPQDESAGFHRSRWRHHDWVATFLDAAGVKPHRSTPGRSKAALGAEEPVEDLRTRALLEDALPQPEGVARRRLEIPVRRGQRLPVQPREGSARARETSPSAIRSARSMRACYRAWKRRLPKHRNATYLVPATKADLLTPSS